MTNIDEIIIRWFNTDFGTGFSNGLVGNIVLIILCLLATVLFAGLIGFEREYYGHAAGLRTHLLIALGSCLVMIISIYGFSYWDDVVHTTRDPARLAAQIIPGIGFLGAGTIVKNGVSVRGLTTATTLWVSMAIGVACGTGCFVIATIATVICLAVLIFLRKFEVFASRKNPIVLLVVPSDSPVMKDILLIANRYGIAIRDSSSELITYQDHSAIRTVLHLAYASSSTVSAFADELRMSIKPLDLRVSTEF